MNQSKRFINLSLALLTTASLGFGLVGSAEANPPDWAPAWGYRCKTGEKYDGDKHNRKVDCKQKERDRKDRDEDRSERNRQRRDRERDGQRPVFDHRNFDSGTLKNGTYIEVEARDRERIVLRRDEVLPLTLRVARDVRDDRGRVLIPEGSRIEGELRPSEGGVRFFARRLILPNGDRYSLDARSELIRPRTGLNDKDLKDTTVSRAARILISSVLGSRDNLSGLLEDILAGRTRVDSRLRSDLVVVYPDDLDLRLRSDLRIR